MKMGETMKRISTEKIVIPGILLGVAIVLVLVDRIFDYHISGTLFLRVYFVFAFRLLFIQLNPIQIADSPVFCVLPSI